MEDKNAKGKYWIAHLKNQWYLATTSKKLTKKPKRITLFDIPIVFFRTESGKPIALLDRCPHRNVPLSLGWVKNENIVCKYHGWELDCHGQCFNIPSLVDTKPKSSWKTPSFSTIEQQGLVWICAQQDIIPINKPFLFPHFDNPQYHHVTFHYKMRGTVHAVLENMLDVPHTAFTHQGLFRNEVKNKITVIIRRSSDRVEAEYVGEPKPTGIVAKLLGMREGKNEIVTHFDRFILPSISQVEYKIGERSHQIISAALTPISDFQTMFTSFISFRLPLPTLLIQSLLKVFANIVYLQDWRIVAGQTKNVKLFNEEKYISTQADVLGPEIWRLLKRAERGDSFKESEVKEEKILMVV